MTQYYGDFLEDETVYIPLNTFSSDDPSASVTITNLADADIKVHKDGSVTQIVTDGATVAIDFDSITGNHLITIDTSAHADYSTGSDYLVRIEGTTVDGATVNAWIGSFSIENRTAARALRATTSGRTLDVTATGAAGIDWGNIENKTTANDLSGTDIQLCDTVTTNTDMRGTDSALLAASAPTNFGDLAIAVTTGKITVGTNDDKTGYSISGTITTLDSLDTAQDTQHSTTQSNIAALNDPTAAAIRTEMDSNSTQLAAIVADTGELQTDWANGGRLDLILDARASQTTADAIETDTQDIQGRLPAALVSGRMDANTSAISDNATAATNLSGSALGIVTGACEATPSTTVIQTDLAEATDDHYIGRVVVFTSGVAQGQASDITDYTGSTGTITVTALTTAPAASDTFVIV